MASEKAKELAAKQKAEAKAAKLRKKTSNDPKDWGTIRQLRETYTYTSQVDKRTPWFVLGSFVAGFLFAMLVTYLLNASWIFGVLIGILLGFSASMFVLTLLAKKATYAKHKGQMGAGQVPLMMLPSKKWSYTPAISGDKSGTMVHRAVGPAGLILVGEGHPSKAKLLLNSEKKRHEQVLYGVPITTLLMGEGEGEVPLENLTKHITKLPTKLNKVEITDLETRLRALDSMRQKTPIPRGPLPNARGMRRAMRGR